MESKFQNIQKVYSINFNSGIAQSLNDSNNKFAVRLYNPISAPSEAKSVQVALTQAQVWNSSPNIVPPNNKLYFRPPGGPDDQVLLIPQGYYGFQS